MYINKIKVLLLIICYRFGTNRNNRRKNTTVYENITHL